ncbi:ROK family transcriptional regulator [Arthrobacter sp. PvP023]|uniref:ROK family transcriptional regulator n=2 Tax=Micrococcaceae TaxID=1268 RepID=UPI0027DC06AD|nr:ROK family transcriptional regulator [Arthrobacter sp. PvP023]
MESMTSPIDSADVRRHNMSLVLRSLADHEPCSRSEIRAATRLVSGTVTTVVEDLMARGLVLETGHAQGGRGRPRRLLQTAPERVRTVAVQLSSHDVVGEVRDFAGVILWERREEHGIGPGRPQDFVSILAAMTNAAMDHAASVPRAWITDPVILLPALVTDDSTVAAALGLGLRRTDLHGPLTEAMKHSCTPVFMNYGRLGSLAEYAATPSDRRPRAMAYIMEADGVSGGIVVDGEVYRGAHGLAGECGHITVNMNGPACGCGARGCLDLYLRLPAIMASAGIELGSGQGQVLALDELIDKLEAGDERAHTALTDAGTALAGAIATMSNFTDLDLVVLGGTLPRLYQWLEPHVDALISARAQMVPEFNPEVVLAKYGSEGPLRGAWLQARNLILDNPADVSRL